MFCTASQEEARSIAKVLVEERLAACVNIASVESFFFWNGEFCEENEALLVIKTERALIERLIKRIKQIHSMNCLKLLRFPSLMALMNILNG
ncbi:MAG: divalent-cation tolerance protein CutA [Candidatus Methanospirare jalkutatii]|nr:divalent-cation tolerance protein CutA [Candidatus Methanospirare jalkutatii]